MSPSSHGRCSHGLLPSGEGAESVVCTPVPNWQPRAHMITSSARPSALSAQLPFSGYSSEFGAGDGGDVKVEIFMSAAVSALVRSVRTGTFGVADVSSFET